VSGKSSGIKVTQVNVGQAIAWKNGYFQFHKATLDEIMRQLTKWYDVEARYEGSLPAREFTGEIPRSATLLEVLQILEVSNVRLNVEGKEIVVKP
jgi:transmembrane sensor